MNLDNLEVDYIKTSFRPSKYRIKFLIEKLFIAWTFIVYLTVLNGNVNLLIVYRYNKCSQPTNSLN